MFRYTVERLLIMIPTLIAISVLTFLIIELPEGDILSNRINELRAQGEEASIAQVEFYRQQYDLDPDQDADGHDAELNGITIRHRLHAHPNCRRRTAATRRSAPRVCCSQNLLVHEAGK